MTTPEQLHVLLTRITEQEDNEKSLVEVMAQPGPMVLTAASTSALAIGCTLSSLGSYMLPHRSALLTVLGITLMIFSAAGYVWLAKRARANLRTTEAIDEAHKTAALEYADAIEAQALASGVDAGSITLVKDEDLINWHRFNATRSGVPVTLRVESNDRTSVLHVDNAPLSAN